MACLKKATFVGICGFEKLAASGQVSSHRTLVLTFDLYGRKHTNLRHSRYNLNMFYNLQRWWAYQLLMPDILNGRQVTFWLTLRL
jgi:hypothetical protein